MEEFNEAKKYMEEQYGGPFQDGKQGM